MKTAFVSFCLLAALAAGAVRGQDLPELGDAAAATLSPAQERAIGYSMLRQLRELPAFLEDPDVTDYLTSTGYRLVAASPDSRIDFTFFALRDSTVNAFAMPGGFIGVHTGLILTAQSESELAAVLAHEVAHVTQRHIARLVAQQERSSMLSMAAVALAILAARSNPQAAAGVMAGAQAQQLASRLAFTRDNEREADRVGVMILERAGFDPHAMPVFLERLQRATRLLDSGNYPSYMRTHPVTYERIADVQNRTFTLPYRQIPDSIEFHLVRAKLRAQQGEATAAVAFFDELLTERKFNSEAGARFGLVQALLRNGDLARAERELPAVIKATGPHPMVVALRARLLVARKDNAGALALLAEGVKAFPGARSLVYDYAEALLTAGRTEEAIVATDSQLMRDQNDGRLYELQARAFSMQGKALMKHKSLAEAYLVRGNLQLAIEQLQLAVGVGDGDFYQLSSAEARLRELRSIAANLPKK
jgi:predicted Zn-dependent protease